MPPSLGPPSLSHPNPPPQLPTPTPSPPGTPLNPSDPHIDPLAASSHGPPLSALESGRVPLQGSSKLNLNGPSADRDASPAKHAGNFHSSDDASVKDSDAIPQRSTSASRRPPQLQPPADIVPSSPATAWPSHASIQQAGAKPSRARGKTVTEASEDKLHQTAKQMTAIIDGRPSMARTVSTPPLVRRKKSHSKSHDQPRSRPRGSSPAPLNLKPNVNGPGLKTPTPMPEGATTPVSASFLAPLSIPTYLQLELAADRPSLSRYGPSDVPYESSAIKFERLRNFLILPSRLEHLLWFGAAACLDAWLYTFTILPLRFCLALSLLVSWWAGSAWSEMYHLAEFVYLGVGRLWRRRRRLEPLTPSKSRKGSLPNRGPRRSSTNGVIHAWPEPPVKVGRSANYRHRRSRSTPSLLQASHKADLLKGFLVILSSILLLNLDPSRMYHNIRTQAAIKLYMIYNVLEVSDRLLSAVGQDILECLFSRETLERNPDGRSKIIRPLWMFVIALVYNVIHAAALLYQVITLNVAVNSYSNALLTLLMSNQFVEIKGAVFKKVEKENLFQLTCADVVERFQLWLMLLIIAMRNVVEIGGLSINSGLETIASSAAAANPTGVPTSTSSILPQAFTFLPRLSGQVLGPFLVVLGAEMLVDWLKHAYVTKFNDTQPAIYSRFLDLLAKDYYTQAFGDRHDLTRRIGLPVLPLACVFVRSAVQTYQMFVAAHAGGGLPAGTQPLAAATAATPGAGAALAHVDAMLRRALAGGRGPAGSGLAAAGDWLAAALIVVVVCLVGFLALLGAKLALGLVLLRWARGRQAGMREREDRRTDVGSRRLGINGMVEVDDEKRRWIYEGDEAGLARLRDKERERERGKERGGRGGDLAGVTRYAMVAKRIW